MTVLGRCGLLLLVCALVGCTARSDRLRARGVQVARSTESALQSATAPRRVALVVGVDAYDDPAFTPLLHAEADAKAIAAVLGAEAVGGFDRVTLLSGPESTRRDVILRALARVSRELLPDDIFVFYFSGHGSLTRDGGKGVPFLVPSDAVAADLTASAIDLQAVRRHFSRLPARRKALIVDACFNGRGKSAVDPGLVEQIDQLVATIPAADPSALSPGEAHLFATSIGRPAFEDDGLGHGLYTHALLQAMEWGRKDADLDGDGVLSAWEAHDWARRQVLERSENVQVPEATIRVVGDGDMILAGDPAARLGRDRAVVFDYGPSSSPLHGSSLVVDGRARGVFPGAVVLDPGPHHIEVRDGEGALRLDGYADIRKGALIGLADLRVMLRQPRVLQSIRAGWTAQPGGALTTIWGPGHLSIESATAWRQARGAARGFSIQGVLGLGVAPTRTSLEGLVRKGRGVFWLGASVGWSGQLRRFRPRLLWQVRATLVPPTGVAGLRTPAEQGRLLLSTGPEVWIGLALNGGLTLLLGGSAQGLVGAIRPGAEVRPHATLQVMAGLEVGL